MKIILFLIAVGLGSQASANELIFKQGFEDTVSVAGTVSGLDSTGLSIRLTSGPTTEDLNLDSNGSFAFASDLQAGNNWSIVILSLPGPPEQSCQLNISSGTLTATGVANPQISCNSASMQWNVSNWDAADWQ